MDRKTELLSLVKDGKNDIVKASQLIDEIIFIEEQLIVLRKLPFIKINPNNPIQQKPTPAFKQYKELLQQYNNSLFQASDPFFNSSCNVLIIVSITFHSSSVLISSNFAVGSLGLYIEAYI